MDMIDVIKETILPNLEIKVRINDIQFSNDKELRVSLFWCNELITEDWETLESE